MLELALAAVAYSVSLAITLGLMQSHLRRMRADVREVAEAILRELLEQGKARFWTETRRSSVERRIPPSKPARMHAPALPRTPTPSQPAGLSHCGCSSTSCVPCHPDRIARIRRILLPLRPDRLPAGPPPMNNARRQP